MYIVYNTRTTTHHHKHITIPNMQRRFQWYKLHINHIHAHHINIIKHIFNLSTHNPFTNTRQLNLGFHTIYAIVSLTDFKLYIGRTLQWFTRSKTHIRCIRDMVIALSLHTHNTQNLTNRHKNKYAYRFIAKNNPQNYTILPLIQIHNHDAPSFEMTLIRSLGNLSLNIDKEERNIPHHYKTKPIPPSRNKSKNPNNKPRKRTRTQRNCRTKPHNLHTFTPQLYHVHNTHFYFHKLHTLLDLFENETITLDVHKGSSTECWFFYG